MLGEIEDIEAELARLNRIIVEQADEISHLTDENDYLEYELQVAKDDAWTWEDRYYEKECDCD